MTLAPDAIERSDHAGEGGSLTARQAAGCYTLSSVASTALVKVAIKGFWDERVMRAFARDFVAEVRKVDGGQNQHVVLVDLSCAAIQSQEIFEAFRAMLVGGQTHARRLAIYKHSLPMRMQARRVTTLRPNVAMFDSEAAALAWLLQESEA